MDEEYEKDILSDDDLDIFRKDYPPHVRYLSMAITDVHDVIKKYGAQMITSEFLDDIADSYNLDVNYLKEVIGASDRVIGEGEFRIPAKNTSQYASRYRDIQKMPMMPELQLIIDKAERAAGCDILNPPKYTYWSARWRAIIVRIALDLLGLNLRQLSGMTQWTYGRCSSSGNAHKEFMKLYPEYRQVYGIVLEEMKEELGI